MSNDEGRKDPPLSPNSKSAAKKMNDGFDTDAAAVPVPGLRMENRHGTDDIDNDGHFRFSGKKDLQLQMRSLIVNFDDEGSEWKARVTVGGDPQNGSASSKIQRKAKEWKLMQVSYEKAIEHKEQMKQGYWFSSRASNPVVVLPLKSDKTGKKSFQKDACALVESIENDILGRIQQRNDVKRKLLLNAKK